MTENEKVEVLKNGETVKYFEKPADAWEYIDRQTDVKENKYTIIDWR